MQIQRCTHGRCAAVRHPSTRAVCATAFRSCSCFCWACNRNTWHTRHRPQHLGPWHAWPCKWAMQRTQWPRPCATGHTCATGHLWATAWLGGTQVGAPSLSGPCGPVACGRVLQHPGSSWGANQLLQHMLQHLAGAVGCCSMGVLLQGLCSMVLGLR